MTQQAAGPGEGTPGRDASTDRAPGAGTPGDDAPEVWDALVIGGGVAGLVAGRELAASGLRTLVLEAWTGPGGAVGRHRVDGLVLDAGAESFATRSGVVATLATDLGLADRIVSPEPRGAWVRLPGGAGPLPRTGLLGIPSDPWAADVRRTLGWAGALRASLDRVLPASVGLRTAGEVTTLGALVRARMGRRVLDRLVRPVVAGVHAAEPDDIAVDAVAPGLVSAVRREGSLGAAVTSVRALAPAGAAVGGIDGGLHVLVDALVTDLGRHGGELRCGTSAVAVERIDGLFRVAVEGAVHRSGTPVLPTTARPAGTAGTPGTDHEDAPGDVLRARRLVVATPRAVDLLTDLAPALTDLHTDPGADIVLATLVLDAPALDGAPRGTGVLVARDVIDVRAKALTHATAKWAWLAREAGPGRNVLRLSYGRADEAPGVEPLPGDLAGLTALALRDAAAILGVPLSAGQVRASARVTW